MALNPGAKLGPYELVALVGRGGMGEVYQAVDTRLGRTVALKLLSGSVVADDDRRARFEREARLIARLQHPHICTLFDVGVSDNTPYLVLEFLEGQSLADRLLGGLPHLHESLTWVVQIADALAYAHDQGVVHRDVKPSNVMLTRRGAKLLDLGLARAPAAAADVEQDVTLAGAPRTTAGLVLGTPGYMSPEQASGVEIGVPTDVFAFGILLYELLTGLPAFRRATLAETMAATFAGPPRRPSDAGIPLPAGLEALAMRCLEADPAGRPGSMREVLDVLSALSRPGAAAEPTGRERTRLPAAAAIVGRDVELAEVSELLRRDECRLVTLAGPGGIGKTRLAIEVGRAAHGHFPGGVVFVGLASVTDPHLLMGTIARAMDVTPQPGSDPENAVVAAFNAPDRRGSLLVLDNFEQLTAASLDLAALVEACPDLKVLVTSRELLRLSMEREYQVPPLALPERGRRMTAESAGDVAAVALFAQRARAVNPGFAITPHNVSAVMEICTQLDGLPLALELAAARMRTLTPQALLARLGRPLQVLTTGARDLPARQQTLRNTIDWSYGLLSQPERRLMRRVGVFAGGCTLDGVEAVCDPAGDLGLDVLDGVASLADKSLLVHRQQSDGDARITMLETIREFAVERLAAAGEADATRRAHAAYCVVLAEEADAALATADREAWLARMDLELDNCRLAFDWLTANGESDWAVRLGLGLFRYWETRGLFLEAGSRFQALLSLGPKVTSVWAKVQLYAGIIGSNLGDFDSGHRLLEQSLRTSRLLGDRPAEAVALNNLGISEQYRGHHLQATAYLERALELWRDLQDDSAVARALSNLANVALDNGELSRARHWYSEALRTFTARGDRESIAWTLCHLGTVASRSGALDEAKQWFGRAVATFEGAGMPLGAASATADLGAVCMEHGEVAEGREHLASALRFFAEVSHSRGVARVLEEFAVAAAREGRASRALRLSGVAASLRKSVGAAPAAERTRVAAALAPFAESDSAGEFEQGRRMPLDEAVALALEGRD